MNYKITQNTIVEADSVEEALRKIASHYSTVARHVGNGESLESCDPAFTIVESAKGDPVPLSDPITEAIAEQKRAEQTSANTVVEDPAAKIDA